MNFSSAVLARITTLGFLASAEVSLVDVVAITGLEGGVQGWSLHDGDTPIYVHYLFGICTWVSQLPD